MCTSLSIPFWENNKHCNGYDLRDSVCDRDSSSTCDALTVQNIVVLPRGWTLESRGTKEFRRFRIIRTVISGQVASLSREPRSRFKRTVVSQWQWYGSE